MVPTLAVLVVQSLPLRGYRLYQPYSSHTATPSSIDNKDLNSAGGTKPVNTGGTAPITADITNPL